MLIKIFDDLFNSLEKYLIIISYYNYSIYIPPPIIDKYIKRQSYLVIGRILLAWFKY